MKFKKIKKVTHFNNLDKNFKDKEFI